MPKSLTASDRSSLIKLAHSLEKGSEERKAILAGLKKLGGAGSYPEWNSDRERWDKRGWKLVWESEDLAWMQRGVLIIYNQMGWSPRVGEYHQPVSGNAQAVKIVEDALEKARWNTEKLDPSEWEQVLF